MKLKWKSQNGKGKEYDVDFDEGYFKNTYFTESDSSFLLDSIPSEEYETILNKLKDGGKVTLCKRDKNSNDFVLCCGHLQYVDFRNKFEFCPNWWKAWEEVPLYPDRPNDGRAQNKQSYYANSQNSTRVSSQEIKDIETILSEEGKLDKKDELLKPDYATIYEKLSDDLKEKISKEVFASVTGFSDPIFQTVVPEIKVRSREEVIIVDRVSRWTKDIGNIQYETEKIGPYVPDFLVKIKENAYRWEHLGGWSIDEYREHNLIKLKYYWYNCKDSLPRLTFPVQSEMIDLGAPDFLDVTLEENFMNFIAKDPTEIYKKIFDRFHVKYD